MINLIQTAIPSGVLILQILVAFFIVSLFFRHSWGKPIVHFLSRWAIQLGIVLSIIVVSGSLFYSNFMGYEPCVLCWWQRIALYPLLPIFVLAHLNNDRKVFRYVFPLAILALVISIYQTYITFGGEPLVDCSLEDNCSKLYVLAYGYITIPMMVTTASMAFLALYLAEKLVRKEENKD